jgi:hypothetical protein
MTCPVCLEPLQINTHYAPYLECHCKYVVHQECWRQWSGECIYCRNTGNIHRAEQLHNAYMNQASNIRHFCFFLMILLLLSPWFVVTRISRYNNKQSSRRWDYSYQGNISSLQPLHLPRLDQ